MKMIHCRGCKILQELLERLNFFLQLAPSRLLTYCQEKIPETIQNDQNYYTIDREECSEENESGEIDSSKRMYIINFQYSKNYHYYFALNCEPFSNMICDWIEAVPDCYLLSSLNF